jgi:DNA-binding MarR family transcriptional regulator
VLGFFYKGRRILVDYIELAERFFYKSYQLKKYELQQIIDENVQGENFALLYIKNRDGFALPGEISEEMNISSARVAVILNNLESKGFIERQIDKTDRRRILVVLTEKGEEKAENHNKEVIAQIAKMLELLGGQDAREFVRITGRIVDLASEMMAE